MRSVSLKWRAVLGVTTLIIAVLVLVSLVQLHFMQADFSRVLAEQQFALVTRMAEDLDAKLETYTDLLTRSAGNLPQDALASPEAVREHYRARPGMLNYFDDVLVIAADGRVIADYPEVPGRAALNFAQRPQFMKVLATRAPVIAGPVRGQASGEPIVMMGAPVIGPDGQVKAVVEGVLRLYSKNFVANLANTHVGRGGYFVILTKEPQPRYVVHPDKSRILQPRAAGGSYSITRALGGVDGSSEDTGSSGVAALYSYKSLRTVPWVLIASVPAEEAYLPLREASKRLWTICLVVSLLVMPLVWVLAWLILRPVTQLRDEFEKLRDGGRGYRPVPVERRDEIGDLTRSFNALMRERAVAETRSRDSEERLRMVTDNLPALISYVDADFRYRFVNRVYDDWFGAAPEGYIGRSMRDVVGEEGWADIEPAARRALEGQAAIFRREMVRGDELRTLEGTLLPDITVDGRVEGFYVLVNDITALTRTKDQLRALNTDLEQRVQERTAALAASNRELETFAYSVAHDFRAPLRAMDSFSALLLEEQGAKLDDEGRDYLARIRASSNRLGRLIDDLLRLAQLSQQALNRESVDLSLLVEQEIAVLRAAEPKRRVEVRVEPGMIAAGDRALLSALLHELIGNAWKFTADTEEARIEFGSAPRGPAQAYYVRDNGLGFDMAFAQKVFTPFTRLHGSDEFTGTGIGLALAKRVIDRHGGRLWAEAEDGEGAAFWFVLPG